MSKEEITPVVLTWNEVANIGRSLARLAWARRVVVVDSGSTDGTQELVRGFANTRLVERPFDSHSRQWESAIRDPAVETDWVLALDADYLVSDALVSEIDRLNLRLPARGYRASFRYCVDGEPLRFSLYPPVTVLFDRTCSRFVQEGHTQRVLVDGPIERLQASLDHDDRKPPIRFAEAQRRYAILEAVRLRAMRFRELPWSGRLRKLRVFAPLVVPIWLLLIRGLVLDGSRGLKYVRQRLVAEWMISRALFAPRRRPGP
jgi:hypothetical protein